VPKGVKKKSTKAVKKALSKREVMVERAVTMLNRTWQAIGHDCLSAMGSDMDKDHVIEVVLDADHFFRGGDKECAEWFRELKYEEMIEIGKKAFRHGVYGL